MLSSVDAMRRGRMTIQSEGYFVCIFSLTLHYWVILADIYIYRYISSDIVHYSETLSEHFYKSASRVQT